MIYHVVVGQPPVEIDSDGPKCSNDKLLKRFVFTEIIESENVYKVLTSSSENMNLHVRVSLLKLPQHELQSQ